MSQRIKCNCCDLAEQRDLLQERNVGLNMEEKPGMSLREVLILLWLRFLPSFLQKLG